MEHQSPATVHSRREGVPPHGESIVAGYWTPKLKLPGGMPARGETNIPEPILTVDKREQ